eukprot:1159223-Pelagomonas_calceolata.AAC.3
MKLVGLRCPPYVPPAAFRSTALSMSVSAVKAKHDSFQYTVWFCARQGPKEETKGRGGHEAPFSVELLKLQQAFQNWA